MREYILMTDNTCDLPETFYDKNGVEVLSLTYILEGQTYTRANSLPAKVFYQKMREGSMPTTSQINIGTAKEAFLKVLQQGKDLLMIAFSSGLSGSYNNYCIAAKELEEEGYEGKIIIVDSLCASLGQGLLVYKAIELKNKGASLEEVAQWAENHKQNVVHLFTVDDLNHLARGGRISKGVAAIGTIINVKPILHVDQEGHLVMLDKVRGRKKALKALVQRMTEQMIPDELVFISHADAEEEAKVLAELIEAQVGKREFLIHETCPTIGAHTGVGMLAIFFMGKVR